MSDYISRADLIEAIEDTDWYSFNRKGELTHGAKDESEAWYKYEDIYKAIDRVPSVSAESYKDGYDDGIREERPKAYKIGYNDGYERGKAECVSAEQVTSKLKKPCDSLLTEDSEDSKEQKSKLDHDREWIIGCIKHDGFIKTDRFDKANNIILDALSSDVEIPIDKTVVHIETYRRLYEKYVDLKNNAVKVVKCKNCRYRFYDKYNDCYMCDRHEYGESFEDDDYCSWGERREDANTD